MFGCCSKKFGCGNKIILVAPLNIAIVTKPLLFIFMSRLLLHLNVIESDSALKILVNSRRSDLNNTDEKFPRWTWGDLISLLSSINSVYANIFVFRSDLVVGFWK